MANKFGTDILIQAEDPKKAAEFYVNALGFEITDPNPKDDRPSRKAHQFIHRARAAPRPRARSYRQEREGRPCQLGEKRLPGNQGRASFPEMLMKDPYGLIYNLTE